MTRLQRKALGRSSTDRSTLGSEAVAAGGMVFLGGRLAGTAAPASDGIRAESYFYRPVRRQLHEIYSGIGKTLSAFNLDFRDLVRVDSGVTHRDHVSSYRSERPRYLGEHLPTSTVVKVAGFHEPGAVIQLTPIAGDPSVLGDVVILESEAMPVFSRDAFSKGLRAGSWVFTSGATAAAHSAVKNPLGLADAAAVDENYWAQSAVKLQTRYVLKTKIAGVLESAELTIKDLAFANVYLTECDVNLGPFWEEWIELFQGKPPATSIVPVDGLGLRAGRVEISAIAFAGDEPAMSFPGASPIQTIPGCPVATRAGGLVWCSSVAVESASDPHDTGSRMAWALTRLEGVLDSAETGLDDLVAIALYGQYDHDAELLVSELKSRLAVELPAISFTRVDAPFYGAGTSLSLNAVALAR